MPPRLVIFDMDDVLCHYDLGRRLRALSQISGKTPRDIRAAIWDSGFEDDADSGGYPDHLPMFLKLLRTPILGWLAVHILPAKTQIRIVLKKSYYDPAKITEQQVDAYAGPLASPGGRHALLEIGKRAIPPDIQSYIDRYPTISVPTLILWGQDDRVLPRLIGERLNAAIPNSNLEDIPQAGHIPQEEQPDAVITHIRAFLP